jgi:C-terminal processing protease CtpA/Prc
METLEEIKQAIDSGIWRFIIDLRGNGGGNSNIGTMLLNGMGMTLPTYGIIRKISDIAREQRPHANFPDTVDKIEIESDINAQNPNKIFVSVLTDYRSFSASTMLGVWVQDGKLGNIIGEPSSNSPSMFGDMLVVSLPKSNISLAISYSRFTRPDRHANQDILLPDIVVPADEALDIALEYLRNLSY